MWEPKSGPGDKEMTSMCANRGVGRASRLDFPGARGDPKPTWSNEKGGLWRTSRFLSS